MDLRTTITRLLCGLALATAVSSPALAEERLVMPFACQVVGGQVVLAPSAPRTYQIFGRREQQRMNTCSPYDARKCHSWSVYRFDLDCGGVPVSWKSVVAAMSPILAESGGTPPEAYAQPYDERGSRGAPGRRISFPPGFAPNPMKVAKFSGSPTPANVPLPPKKPDVVTPDTAEQQVAAAEPDLGLEVPAAPEDIPEIETVETPKGAAPDPAAKPASKPTKQAEVAEEKTLSIEVESGSGEVTGTLPGAASRNAGSFWLTTSNIFMLTLALLFALTATLFFGRRGMLALPVPAPTLRLRGPAGLPALRRSLVSEWKDAAARLRGRKSESRLRIWDEDWLPTNKSEAYEVLGVDPRAGREAIKSTVTRLRRALHPDYAFDEEDRLMRERRLKQINAAWDLLGGKRRAPWIKPKPRRPAPPKPAPRKA